MILLKKQVAAKVLVGVAVVGVAFSPVMASAATDTTTVTATVDSAISVSSTGAVAISVNPATNGGVGTGSDTVTVDSNDVDGYTLTINNDATLTLDGDGETIAPTTGTLASPAALDTNSWGFRVAALPAFATAGTYAQVPSTAGTIRDTTAVASNEQTTVEYGVKVDVSQPNGAYSDTVTYTATVKP